MANVKVFFEKYDLDISPWLRQMTLIWCQRKGLATSNKHVTYESSITYHSKVMANAKVLLEK